MAAMALCLPAVATLSSAEGYSAGAAAQPSSSLPQSITLEGTVRDFRARNQDNGHNDFQWQPKRSDGRGSYSNFQQIVADELDADGKPVFRSRGHRVTSHWRNANNENIMSPREYIAEREGDKAGSMDSEGHAVHDAEGFSQWFRDVPGVNVSQALPITLVLDEQTGKYVFDDKNDPNFSSLGGFFPVNGELYGNYTNDKNFHFTYELSTQFVYREGQDQSFKFIGDDDVWVFIDNKLVIDIGGVHPAVNQVIELDRLEWLEDGQTYPLHFFFAERHTSQSNFRIETTLQLRSVDLPTSAALYD